MLRRLVEEKQLLFQKIIEVAIAELASQRQRDRMFFLPTVVTSAVIDRPNFLAAWILFEHVAIIEQFPYVPVWRRSAFRYTVWMKRYEEAPRQLYERSLMIHRLVAAPLSAGWLVGDIDRLAVAHSRISFRDRALGFFTFTKDGQFVP